MKDNEPVDVHPYTLTVYAMDLAVRSAKRLYDLFSGNRGPDELCNINQDVKTYRLLALTKSTVNGRIRCILFGSQPIRQVIWNSTPLDHAEGWEKRELMYLLETVAGHPYRHYLHHCVKAIEASADHPIWGTDELAHELMKALDSCASRK